MSEEPLEVRTPKCERRIRFNSQFRIRHSHFARRRLTVPRGLGVGIAEPREVLKGAEVVKGGSL